ncbi:MAG TPA: SLC13 family permease [Anaeromyxobacteraceae bacterium]|nr:SLC13 family permease [Anaeromyxobacteraceae bacterium]
MTLPIAITLGVLVMALVLFAIERIPLEVSALCIPAALAVTGVLAPDRAFAGFADSIVIFEFTLLAMTQGLAATGVIQGAGQRLAALGRRGEGALQLGLMALVTAVSSVVSNTVTVAAFLPVAIGAADRARVVRSKVLIPVAYAAMLGGTLTLVGTSTNLVVSSLMQRSGLAGLGFAELTPVAAPFALAGIAFVLLTARFLLPRREAEGEADVLPAREYLAEVVVVQSSPYAGRPLSEVTRGLGLRVLALVRGGATLEPDPAVPLSEGDALVVEEDRLDLLRVLDLRGLEMRPDAGPRAPPAREDVILVEASVPPGSSLVGRSLADAFFAEHFGVDALALARRPAIQRLTRAQLLGGLFGTSSLTTVPLAAGDVLLLRGARDRLRGVSDGGTLALLANVEYRPIRHRKALVALAIFLAVLVGAATRALPYGVLGTVGMLAMIATRCVDARQAFKVDWRVALLIACMLALGTAMESTGAGRYVGSLLMPVAHVLGSRGMLLALMVATVALSAPMSNQAAAAVLLPIAAGVAEQLGVSARPFVIGVCFAASCSFITPLEPACVLVYGPGRYRFTDFVKVGTPLTLLLLAMLTALIPLRWSF